MKLEDAQESLRIRAVKAVAHNGKACTETARLMGVARGTVSKWVSNYRRNGESTLLKKKRGRRSSDMRLLQPYQCGTIVNMIRDRCPDQLKLPFMLWTRQAVQGLIDRQFGIKLALNTVGLYLKRWGFTSQKPLRRGNSKMPRDCYLFLQ
jgi:transposase